MYLYKLTRDNAITRRNILARQAAARLSSFNLQRELYNMLKLPIKLSCSTTTKADISSQNKALQTPIIPLTLIIVEALILLYNLIRQDIYAASSSKREAYKLRKDIFY